MSDVDKQVSRQYIPGVDALAVCSAPPCGGWEDSSLLSAMLPRRRGVTEREESEDRPSEVVSTLEVAAFHELML